MPSWVQKPFAASSIPFGAARSSSAGKYGTGSGDRPGAVHGDAMPHRGLVTVLMQGRRMVPLRQGRRPLRRVRTAMQVAGRPANVTHDARREGHLVTTRVDGCLVDDRTAAVTAEVKLRLYWLPVRLTQGSYTSAVGASGGTHAGGGAADVALADISDDDARLIETTLRSCGCAAWYRTAIPGVWPRHVHFLVLGTPDFSPQAAAQTVDYAQGRDGLASRGRDTGDRSFVNVRWETYFPPADAIARAVWQL